MADAQAARAKAGVERMTLYSLMISQLHDDGYTGAAAALADATMLPAERLAPNRLARLLGAAVSLEEAGDTGFEEAYASDERAASASEGDAEADDGGEGGGPASKKARTADHTVRSLNLDEPAGTPHVPQFNTKFITTHKAACSVAKISPNGLLLATGSEDSSIKLLDVNKMVNYHRTSEDFAAGKPVLRTLYGHTQGVTDLDWHPFRSVLVSCAKDSAIKFFDFGKQSKHAFQSMQDTHAINSIAYHPSGDFVLAATQHNLVRVFDAKSLSCYTATNSADHHADSFGINQVRCSADGSMFATAGSDGLIKLWDVVSGTCAATLHDAHDSKAVTSLQFSRSGKYLLSCGLNHTVVLWDLAKLSSSVHTSASSAQPGASSAGAGSAKAGAAPAKLLQYTGARTTRPRTQACFSHDEAHVLCSDDGKGCELVVWDARKAEQVQRVAAGHNGKISWLAHSPTDGHAVTCSDDHRARFWTTM